MTGTSAAGGQPVVLSAEETAMVRRALDPGRAAEEVRKLRDEAGTAEVRRSGPEHSSWKAKVDADIERALRKDSETLRSLRELRYHVGIWTGAPGIMWDEEIWRVLPAWRSSRVWCSCARRRQPGGDARCRRCEPNRDLLP